MSDTISSSVSPLRAPGALPASRACLVAFLAAATTLFAQVLVHRMVSAKLLNNYAFLVISLTMLGFAFSGVLLTRLRGSFLRNWNDALSLCASGFVLSAVAVSAAFYHAAGGNQFAGLLGGFVREAARWIPMALLFAVPFAFTGLMLGALLSDERLPTRWVYGVDLLGSATGALVVIPSIRAFGVEASALGASAAFLAGTVLCVPPRRRSVRALAGVAALGLVFSAAFRTRVFEMRARPGSFLTLGESLGPPFGLEYLQWDPVARIEVSRIPPPDPEGMLFPSLIGGNRGFHERFRRMLTQNDYAFTYMVDYDGRPESLSGIEETIYASAYEATSVSAPRVLVIGVGGGFDVLVGLRYGASEITGVEINGATVDIVTRVYERYCRAWVRDPRTRLVEDEGRHYLATAGGRFDVIQLSGVDSYSGTPAAAHVFSESYLYTAEAFDLYLSRLTERGILNVMRLETVPPREMLRALTTAVDALRRAGVAHPAEHILMVSANSGNFSAMLVKKTPFSATEQGRAAAWAGANPFVEVSAAPGLNGRRANMYQAFLDLGSPARERAFVSAYPFDVSPVTDDRPFFFRHSSWRQLFARSDSTPLAPPVMEMSLVLLASAIAVVAIVCVYVPTRLLGRGAERASSQWRYALFFGAIGVGYFGVEIALLQKFGLFLGHPNYALSVVLAALLLATGLGALASRRALAVAREIRFLAYGLAAIILALYGFALPLLPTLASLAFPLRATLVAVLVLPPGAVMGVFLPAGLERLKTESPSLAPWAWGVNGVFSVLGPVASIALSVTWGINALLLAAVPIYLVAGLALPPLLAERRSG